MTTPVAPARRPARDKIFKAAKDLFYRHGIRAVGVESIAEEAGCTKMSLYRSFDSKDDLVVECLQEHMREFHEWREEVLAKHPGNPKAQLLALMDGYAERARDKDFRGCPLANAAVELEEDHAARAVVLEHKKEFREWMTALCKAAGARQPAVLADALALLIEGSHTSRLTYKQGGGPYESLPLIARTLIDAHCG